MKNIYVTWHWPSHGTTFLQQILAAYYQNKFSINKAANEESEELVQEDLERAFKEKPKGFLFDEVWYFTFPQETIDRIVSPKAKIDLLSNKLQNIENLSIEEKKKLQDNSPDPEISIEDQKHWLEVFQQNLSLPGELDYIKEKMPGKKEKFLEQLWRFIHYYPLEDQITWFHEYSNASQFYKDKFERIEVPIKKEYIHDYQKIAELLSKKFSECLSQKDIEYPSDVRFVINISSGTPETHVLWFSFIDKGILSSDTQFICSYDKKDDKGHAKFKKFTIKRVPPNIFSSIKFSIFEKTESSQRKLAKEKMAYYQSMGFPILILGERGTGKSRLPGKNVIIENCASFEDSNMAESALFGHVKGAFTGAVDKKGLFERANNQILFLDEIHHLSITVQAKLNVALQPNKDKKFSFRPLGSEKDKESKFLLICASNLDISELRQKLLPDFYDRISHLIIEIPPLRETRDDIEKDWEQVWKEQFPTESSMLDENLKAWLKNQPLYGNYRDLQKIAVLIQSYNKFSKALKDELGSRLNFVKSEFKKYHGDIPTSKQTWPFSREQSANQMIQQCKKEYIVWLEKTFGSLMEGLKYLNETLKDKITYRTLHNWKNPKD